MEPPCEFPKNLRTVYEWFGDLHRTRPVGFAVSAISYSEIHAYFSLIGFMPQKWELIVLRAFDDVALEEQRKQEDKKKSTKK